MSLQQVTKNNYTSKYIRFVPIDGVEMVKSKSGYHQTVAGTPVATYLGGKEDGLVVEGSLKAGQSAVLVFGSIHPERYQVLAEVNPELYFSAAVFHQGIYDADDGQVELTLVVTARKTLDLDLVPWYLKIYGID